MSIQLIIVGVLGLAIIIYGFVAYNILITARNKVEEAFSLMDVCMKKRFDLVPSLVSIVRGYTKYEAETLQKAANHRSGVITTNEKVNSEMKIGQAVNRILMQAEAYPDLKADDAYISLQKELVGIEEEIMYSRRYYNGSVREFNTSCQKFPLNIVANMFGFHPRTMYEVENEKDRKVVEVNLS
ncbi:MAG: LemA family protein [Prevotellaceae bacterium]|nr:LemA family protein [Candidatus Minthosoma caballi]